MKQPTQPHVSAAVCSISRLNDDCLMRVFDACGGDVPTLVIVGRVCRRWKELGGSSWLVSD